MAENFIPGETVSLAASTSSASITFSLAQSASFPDCMVSNAGTQTAYISFGLGTGIVAALPGQGVLDAIPVLSGETMILRKGVGNSTCAAITATGSTTLYFTAGQGS